MSADISADLPIYRQYILTQSQTWGRICVARCCISCYRQRIRRHPTEANFLHLSPKKIKVKIVNPIAGRGITSLAHARRYVSRGVAEWIGDGQIRMLDCHQRASAERTLRPIVSDGSGYATLEAIAGLPCVAPIKLLIGKRGTPPGEHIHRPVHILSAQVITRDTPPPASWPTDLYHVERDGRMVQIAR